MTTVYVSIGNTDDKLTQLGWSRFYQAVDEAVRAHETGGIYGVWISPSVVPYQNACWAFEIDERAEVTLRVELMDIAAFYAQDAITWAEAQTEFLSP
jgi:hypothetical protein